MVTGITVNSAAGPPPATMTANIIGAPVTGHNLKDATASSAASAAAAQAAAAAASAAASASAGPVKSDRRSNKPIMEKRRRARINNCLNELKTLILDATKKDPARHSKLEKADILEKTVKHLQELQRQQAALQQAVDPKVVDKFKAGFTDCANEVSRFPGLDAAVKRRLLQHLHNCMHGVKSEMRHQQRQAAAAAAQQHLQHAQMLPSPPSSPEQDQQHHHHLHHQQQQQQQQQYLMGSTPTGAGIAATTPLSSGQIQASVNGYFLPNGLQVIPTKGSIALVLPQQQQPQLAAVAAAAAAAASAQQQHQQQHHQLQHHHQHSHPMIVTVPSRTASTGSASSHSSSGYERLMSSPTASIHYAPPSPANSYEAMDCKQSVIQHASAYVHQQQQQQQQQQHNQQPLSLVIKKNIKEEDQPWRPW